MRDRKTKNKIMCEEHSRFGNCNGQIRSAYVELYCLTRKLKKTIKNFEKKKNDRQYKCYTFGYHTAAKACRFNYRSP